MPFYCYWEVWKNSLPKCKAENFIALSFFGISLLLSRFQILGWASGKWFLLLSQKNKSVFTFMIWLNLLPLIVILYWSIFHDIYQSWWDWRLHEYERSFDSLKLSPHVRTKGKRNKNLVWYTYWIIGVAPCQIICHFYFSSPANKMLLVLKK